MYFLEFLGYIAANTIFHKIEINEPALAFLGSIAFAMNRPFDEHPIGSLELCSTAHTM